MAGLDEWAICHFIVSCYFGFFFSPSKTWI